MVWMPAETLPSETDCQPQVLAVSAKSNTVVSCVPSRPPQHESAAPSDASPRMCRKNVPVLVKFTMKSSRGEVVVTLEVQKLPLSGPTVMHWPPEAWVAASCVQLSPVVTPATLLAKKCSPSTDATPPLIWNSQPAVVGVQLPPLIGVADTCAELALSLLTAPHTLTRS